MVDPGLLREQMDVLRAALARRGIKADAELEQLATLEARRRRLIPELEGLKREQNAAGDEVARAKRQGLDASSIFAANKARGQRIRQLEKEADLVFRSELSRLFHDEGVDAKSILREKEVLENLEHAVDRCERVAHTLANLAIKHG